MTRPIVSFTERAQERIKKVLDANPTSKAIRISVSSKGCSGLSYVVNMADEPKKFEDVINLDNGSTVYIDPAASMFIIGTEVDYQDNLLQAGFVFNNPNAVSSCGCGESFSVDMSKAPMDPDSPFN